MNKNRARYRPAALDVATFVVLAVATYMLIHPGSALYAAGSRRMSQWRLERAIAKDWAVITATAQPLYAGTGEPEVVVFSDYECPFCRLAHPVLDSAVKQGIRISMIQLPLRIHVSAKPAARAALCGVKLGSFHSIDRFLMTTSEWQRDTTRLRSPGLLGVPDSVAYRACFDRDQTAEALASNIAISDSIGVLGTPTVVSRGRILRRPPSVAAIRELIGKADQ